MAGEARERQGQCVRMAICSGFRHSSPPSSTERRLQVPLQQHRERRHGVSGPFRIGRLAIDRHQFLGLGGLIDDWLILYLCIPVVRLR